MAKPAKKVRKVKKDLKVRKTNRLTESGSDPSRKHSGLIWKRKKNNPIRPGMQLGELEVLQRVNTAQGASGGQKWRCACSCGAAVTVPQWYLVRKEYPKRHCGATVHRKQKLSFPRERGIWYMMHRRCYNSTHIAYKHYGGATPPIGVCDPWNKDKVGAEIAWENFIADMGPAPCIRGEKYTLDRINPYKNYGWVDGVLNCRWASASEQMNNLKRHWKKPEEVEALAEAEHFDVEPEEVEEEEEDEGPANQEE